MTLPITGYIIKRYKFIIYCIITTCKKPFRLLLLLYGAWCDFLERTVCRRRRSRLWTAVWVNDLWRSLSRILWPRKPAYHCRTAARVFPRRRSARAGRTFAGHDIICASRPYTFPRTKLYRIPRYTSVTFCQLLIHARIVRPEHFPYDVL